jgi:dTDP-L-rhamnose 4-epimerase
MYEVLLEKPEIRKGIKKVVVASSKSIYGEGAYVCKAHGVVYPGLRKREQLERGIGRFIVHFVMNMLSRWE